MDTVRLLIVAINLLSVEGLQSISRTEGANDVFLNCLLNQLYAAIPFWKINDTIYYFSDLPPPFTSENGRRIVISIVELSLNGTSFQCFIPSSSEGDILSSPTGVLTVTEKGNNYQTINHQNDQQAKLALDHQRFFFTPALISLAWKTVTNKAQYYSHYQLTAESSYDSNSKVLVNRTENESISLQPEDLLDEGNASMLLTLASFDEKNIQYLSMETFRIDTQIITEDIYICLANQSEQIMSVPPCITVPPVKGRKTLVLAIPFLLLNSSVMQDFLCPVHPLPGKRCVDLLSCNRFSESAYANSITICQTTNDNTSLEMCFHNITDAMNGTKLHFFYSDLLQCSTPKPIRTYIRSLQLIIDEMPADLTIIINHTIYNTEICFNSSLNCYQDNKSVFSVSVKDKSGCISYQSNTSIDGSCIPFNTIPMNTACASSYNLEVAVSRKIIYSGPIMQISGFDDALVVPSSKCSCYDPSTTVTVTTYTVHQFESTQVIAVVLCIIIALVIVMLLVAIIIVTYRNIKKQ